MAEKIERIFLVGMPASGKTRAALALRARLAGTWLVADTDAAIAARSGKTVRELMAAGVFREEESKLLREWANFRPVILSTGGGLPIFGDNMAWLLAQKNALVVWLNPPLSTLEARLSQEAEAAQRPMWTGLEAAERWEKLRKLWAERAPIYARAQIEWDSTMSLRGLLQQLRRWGVETRK